MGELIGAGHIAHGKDVGEIGAQEGIHLHRTTFAEAHTQLFEAETADIGLATQGHQDLITGDAHLFPLMQTDQMFFPIDLFHPFCLMAQAYIDAFGLKARLHQGADLGVFATHDAAVTLHLGDLATEALKGLGEL